MIGGRELEEVASIYRALESASDHIRLASRRLSAAMLRDDDVDTIVDLCIGLEAALGDRSSTSEITHKLALRTAAILALEPTVTSTASEIYRDVKDIYSYRSAVVHGGTDQDKKRNLRDSSGQRASHRCAPTVAQDYLRQTLMVLSARPELGVDGAIDEKLILPSLSASYDSPGSD